MKTILPQNFLLAQDTYKASHYLQLPEDVRYVQSVIVPRKANYYTNEIVVAGTTYLSKYLEDIRISHTDIDEYVAECKQQGVTPNEKGWRTLQNRHLGALPLRVTALPEGTVVNSGTAIVAIENTDPDFPWLTSFVETVVQRIIWKFCTVASISRQIYSTLLDYAIATGTPVESVAYKLHNFGDRGADGGDSAVIAGIAHGMLFSGSDCLSANRYIKRLYNTDKSFLSSIEASEHSTMCINSIAAERNDYGAAVMAVERLIEAVKRPYGLPMFSVVIDTYDSHRFVREYLGSEPLKSKILNSGGTLVLRPDSGDPIFEPIEILKIAEQVFGSTLNAAGYKVLPSCVRVIQGDGINNQKLKELLAEMTWNGFALENMAFGMGGGLTHEAGRDEFSFAMKAVAYKTDVDNWIPIKKDPITDPGKASLSGYITNCDTVIFENGFSKNTPTFEEVRARAAI